MSGFRWVSGPAGPRFLQERLEVAHAAALEASAQVARQRAPRRTGEYAGSIDAIVSGLVGRVGSSLVRATAIERGADVGPRRGPHMAGQPTVRPAVLDTYRPALRERMRAG